MIHKVNSFRVFKNNFSQVGQNTNKVIEYIQSLVKENHYIYPEKDIFQKTISMNKNALYRIGDNVSQFIVVGLNSVITVSRKWYSRISGKELEIKKYIGDFYTGVENSKCKKITNVYKNCFNGKVDEISKMYINSDGSRLLTIYSKPNRVSKFPSTTVAQNFKEKLLNVTPEKSPRGEFVYNLFIK